MYEGTRRVHWLARSVFAGVAAAMLGAGLCTVLYLQLPGAERLDWSSHWVQIAAYVGLTGMCAGVGIGGSMALATGSTPRRASAGLLRLVVGATFGTMIGGIVPAIVGIAHFGSFHAPYAGTANILLSVLAAGTTFVVLWAPVLDDRATSLPRIHRMTLALVSATIAATSMGALGWTLATALDVLPSFAWMQATARQIGLVEFGAVAGVFVCAWIGLYMGLATWLDLTLSLAWAPARCARARG